MNPDRPAPNEAISRRAKRSHFLPRRTNPLAPWGICVERAKNADPPTWPRNGVLPTSDGNAPNEANSRCAERSRYRFPRTKPKMGGLDRQEQGGLSRRHTEPSQPHAAPNEANFKIDNKPSRKFVPAGFGGPAQSEGAPPNAALGRDLTGNGGDVLLRHRPGPLRRRGGGWVGTPAVLMLFLSMIGPPDRRGAGRVETPVRDALPGVRVRWAGIFPESNKSPNGPSLLRVEKREFARSAPNEASLAPRGGPPALNSAQLSQIAPIFLVGCMNRTMV
jgi:hypothetical protein